MSRCVVVRIVRQEPEDDWPEICQRAWNTPTPQEDVAACEQCGCTIDSLPCVGRASETASGNRGRIHEQAGNDQI